MKKHFGLYMLVLCVEAMACFSICFFVGLLLNNEYIVLESDSASLTVNITPGENAEKYTVDELEPMLKELLNIINRKWVHVNYNYNDMHFEDDEVYGIILFDYFTYKDGVYKKAKEIENTIEVQIAEGRCISNEEYISGKPVAISFGKIEGMYELGDKFSIFSDDYEVVGVRRVSENSEHALSILNIPVSAWGDIPVGNINIQLECLLTEGNRVDLEQLVHEWYGDDVDIYDYSVENEDLKSAYKSIYIICIGILFATVGILVMLYQYLFVHRRRQLMIEMLCGCSRQRAIRSFVIENLVTSAVAMGIGLLIFITILKSWLEKEYIYMGDIYNSKLLGGIYLILILICTLQSLIMGVANIRGSVKEMLV